MLWLGLETSTARSNIALARGEVVLAERVLDTRQDLSRRLMAEVDAVCAADGLSPRDLGAVAVGLGPGGFTGLRVGVTTAKALAQALSIPILGVPTLDIMAHQMLSYAQEGDMLCPLLDARRDEFFASLYARVGGEAKKMSEERARSPDLLAELVRSLGRPVALAGPVEALEKIEFPPSVRLLAGAPRYPQAGVLIALAQRRLAERGPDDLVALRPIYVRASYAEEVQAARGC